MKFQNGSYYDRKNAECNGIPWQGFNLIQPIWKHKELVIFTLALSKHGHAAGSASALLGLLAFLFGAALAPLVGIAGSANALPMGILIAAANIGAVACYIFMVRKVEQKAQKL